MHVPARQSISKGRAGRCKAFGRLAHAAGLNHSHQNVEIAQFNPTSDILVPLTWVAPVIRKSVMNHQIRELSDYEWLGYWEPGAGDPDLTK